MVEDISRTLKKKSLDGIFNEVVHNEKLGISNNEELHLFYLAVRGNKFYTEDLQTALYRNIGRYVFSRAALEDFHINDDDDSIISQALKVMSENGEFDAKGTGNELGEMLIYAMLEEMLGARKLMSRVEIDSNPLSNGSECESIHLLSGTDSNGKISYEMVFGASNIIGDIKDAIDNAFEEIERIEKHGNKDIKMVEKTALSGFYNKSEIDFIKKHIIPEPGKSGDYEIAYGVFLGYTLGLNSTGLSSAEYKEKVNRRLELDIKQHASYIANKIITKTKKLAKAIREGSHFPEAENGYFSHKMVYKFLDELRQIFDWDRYEYSTLGKKDKDGEYRMLSWYAVILSQWMEGHGLNNIMRKALTFRRENPYPFYLNR